MNILRMSSLSAVFCLVAALSPVSTFASTIDIPVAPGASYIQYWGPSSGGNQSYGEIFTAPDPVIDDYSFLLRSSNPFPFVSQIYSWNPGTGLIGSALYTSAIQQTTTSSQTFTFDPNLTWPVPHILQ